MMQTAIAMNDDLEALQRKIDEAKTHAGGNSNDAPAPVNMGYALRFAIELFSGIATGAALGYFADRWLKTFPWLLILGLFLGAAAGFKNLIREAGKDNDSPRR